MTDTVDYTTWSIPQLEEECQRLTRLLKEMGRQAAYANEVKLKERVADYRQTALDVLVQKRQAQHIEAKLIPDGAELNGGVM